MSKLGKRLIRAAKEARNIAQGKAKASSYRIHLRGDIDVQSLRKQLGLTQAQFSARFEGVVLSAETVEREFR
jgi:putative transcriptional regulator